MIVARVESLNEDGRVEKKRIAGNQKRETKRTRRKESPGINWYEGTETLKYEKYDK